MTPTDRPARRRLGARLRELRALRFRSGSALAEHLGWVQSRVSKLETGAQLPSEADLDTWVAATGVGPDVRAELAELVMAARLDYHIWSEAFARPGGIAALQDAYAHKEAAATRLATLTLSVIPGLLQTVAYATELLTVLGPMLGGDPAEVASLVAARMRRQNVLYTPGKRIQMVIGEGALRTWFGTPETLRGQRDRLVQAIDLPGVEIGIAAFGRPNPAPALGEFALHDSDVVFVESLTGEQRIEAPDEVAVYVRAFEAAMAAAVTGADAAALIRSIT
ncbi:MAG: helix-turn-helix domain-containing protein [Pseudonocardiales bacterium]|nr:helix-turn-helix domain-containing protein [Pseudonocardiales bacterium]